MAVFFTPILERFVEETPFAVMIHGLLENVFAPAKLDLLFERHTNQQYTKTLLFSTATDLLAQVVCSARPSVHAAYQHARQQGQIAVTVKALYDKLAHIELATSRGLVRHTALEVGAILAHFGNPPEPLLEGYDVRILDGNHPSGTQKRLDVLKGESRAALPGVIVALLNPQTRLIEDVALSLDGHAQECTLVEAFFEHLCARQLWIADRHYCTSKLLFTLMAKNAFFLLRQHAGHLRWELIGKRRRRGRIATGTVYEQAVELTDPLTGETQVVRRITVELDEPTRDGEKEIHLLSNVPKQETDAKDLADLYLERWLVETAFRDLTVYLGCEVNTLGYPPAALFGFCLAVASYNVMAAVKGAVRSVHGQKEEEKLSTYYVQDELSGTSRGMAIAVPDQEWAGFRKAKAEEMARLLEQLARGIDLAYYGKNPSKPRKAKPSGQPGKGCGGDKHVSTHRLLHPDLYPKKKNKPGRPAATKVQRTNAFSE